jgi:pimeloyl-ACP methyl ester carboxylesterase
MTTSDTAPALGICLEGYEYPYPVQFLSLSTHLQPLRMAYMDVRPKKEPNGRTVVLFHAKAFGCYYFHNVIEALTGSGYRVVAPDQIGWGKSSKPDIHYSFQVLAANTAALLDHLGVGTVCVLGHSTGGMTATRFTLMNPAGSPTWSWKTRSAWPTTAPASRRNPRKRCISMNWPGPIRPSSAATSRDTSSIPTPRSGNRWPTSWSASR